MTENIEHSEKRLRILEQEYEEYYTPHFPDSKYIRSLKQEIAQLKTRIGEHETR